MLNVLFLVLLLVTAIFLILIILVQRGKGGGLAGALGGMGGQSAFGTKAGDLFTRITIGVAAVWIVLCICSVAWLKTETRLKKDGGGETQQQTQQAPSDQKGAGTTPAPKKSGS